MAPDTVVVNHELSLSDLPPYGPIAGGRPPQMVRLEEELTRAGGLILASPPVAGDVAEPVHGWSTGWAARPCSTVCQRP